MNTQRQQQKRSQAMKADMNCDMKLKQKAFQGIFMSSVVGMQKKVVNHRAQQFQDSKLLRQAMNLMKLGVMLSRDQRVRREYMAGTLLKVDNEITLKTAFQYFKLGTTIS